MYVPTTYICNETTDRQNTINIQWNCGPGGDNVQHDNHRTLISYDNVRPVNVNEHHTPCALLQRAVAWYGMSTRIKMKQEKLVPQRTLYIRMALKPFISSKNGQNWLKTNLFIQFTWQFWHWQNCLLRCHKLKKKKCLWITVSQRQVKSVKSLHFLFKQIVFVQGWVFFIHWFL